VTFTDREGNLSSNQRQRILGNDCSHISYGRLSEVGEDAVSGLVRHIVSVSYTSETGLVRVWFWFAELKISDMDEWITSDDDSDDSDSVDEKNEREEKEKDKKKTKKGV
jgi:hypothetical protein